jgi:hypothetical protein
LTLGELFEQALETMGSAPARYRLRAITPVPAGEVERTALDRSCR